MGNEFVKEKPKITFKILAKYFAHGIAFSGILLAIGFVWIFIWAVLVTVGLFLGFILGLIVLFFIMGGINVYLAYTIWGISARSDWKSILVHGFVLSILFTIVSIPAIIVNFSGTPTLATQVVTFIIYCFIDGFIAKNVSEFWEE